MKRKSWNVTSSVSNGTRFAMRASRAGKQFEEKKGPEPFSVTRSYSLMVIEGLGVVPASR